MTKTKLSISEIYRLKQELEGASINTEKGPVPISPSLISFFKDLRLKYWLQKFVETLTVESDRFEKIKKDYFKETFGDAPTEEDLKRVLPDGTPNEKVSAFESKIEELAQEIIEVEHYPFNEGHLDKLKTTYYAIPTEDKTNQTLVASEDITGKYINQEFTPVLFLSKIVEPCI